MHGGLQAVHMHGAWWPTGCPYAWCMVAYRLSICMVHGGLQAIHMHGAWLLTGCPYAWCMVAYRLSICMVHGCLQAVHMHGAWWLTGCPYAWCMVAYRLSICMVHGGLQAVHMHGAWWLTGCPYACLFQLPVGGFLLLRPSSSVQYNHKHNTDSSIYKITNGGVKGLPRCASLHNIPPSTSLPPISS